MTNLTRSNFQAHPFHLVSPSPWPLFTSIALLSLTTTGRPLICLYKIKLYAGTSSHIRGQSAGNLGCFNTSGIFRDYTLESFYRKIHTNAAYPPPHHMGIWGKENENFSYHLAGLIESDGCIVVPKSERSPIAPKGHGRLNYPSIQIVFDSRDLPFALVLQKELRNGSIRKQKGANAYVLTFNSKESILLIVSLINGKMRTPKIEALYRLIDWLKDSSIKKLPLNTEPLDSNAWLAGFIEGDGHFYVRVTGANKKRNYGVVECRFELTQAQKTPIRSSVAKHGGGLSNYNFMKDIGTILGSSFKEVKGDSKHPQYLVRTINLTSNIKMESYLDKYPLFSSKFLNYKDWLKVLEYKKIRKYDTDSIEKIIEIKNGMNNKREKFIWDHLQRFYKLKDKI